MTRSLIVVALLLSACGPGAAYECTVPGIRSLVSEAPIDCIVVRDNFTLARQLLTARIIPPGEFAHDFGDIDFTVTGARTFDVWGVIEVWGYQDSFTGRIYVGRTMQGLAHEMLHQFDTAHGGGLTTGLHEGWSTNGYDEVSANFANVCDEPEQ